MPSAGPDARDDRSGARTARRLAVALIAAGLSACGLLGPPEWVERMPEHPGVVYGIGSAGTTWEADAERARDIAYERALADLARHIRSAIQGDGLVRDDAGGPGATIRFTEQDLEAIDIVSTWVDEHGRAGPENQTWVLVRMPADRARLVAARVP